MPERGADRAPGGVDAGDQEQLQRAQHMDVGQRLPVFVAGVHQARDQVVGRVFFALFDMAGEIFAHLMDRAHHDINILDAQFEDFVDPFDEKVAILFRDAEHMRNRPNRNVLGVTRSRVAFAVGNEFVDQPVADRAHPGLKLLHGVGREWRQQ
jgi:hypothetical protein